MEKFNKKTLIIGLLIFVGVVILVLTTFAQSPPTNLIAEVQDENDVNLFWTAPSTGDSTYLHWDNGVNYTSYGNFIQPWQVDYAAKWDPEHIAEYDGWTITKMRFYVTVPMPTIKLVIMTGDDATEIYSQDVPTFNVNSWTEITLDTPITIDATTQLWAGLNIDMPVTGGVMGCDEGPAISGYGDLYRFNNVWYNGGLNWNIQIQIKEPELPTYLHWDSGENEDSFGNFLQPAEFDFASKWDPSQIEAYDGWSVTKMRFFITNPMPTVKLKIWSGPEATEIYSQDVTDFTINGWTEVTLDNPVIVDASTQFWVGLNVDMPESGAVMGADSGPAIDGYGNIYRFNNIWYSDFNLNWNIHFQVENLDSKEVDGLLGYNVYRNDEQINEIVSSSPSYIDEDMLNGTYNYYVTALYDEGESDPSNTVEVIVAQPIIAYADSMALVDLYNNCNGPNWWGNELWLEGPVSEWYGVTTTETRVTDLHLHSNGLSGDLPISLGDLTALETLWLESNSITSVPESIGNLTALVELWLGWNPFTVIPGTIGNLVNLKQLHLGQMENPLGTLPDEICNLESLEWFALGTSGLNSLPDNFGNLTSVESCFLQGNYLTELPVGFGGMESLHYLSLDENQLTTLPDSFGDLDNLSTLRIEENQLTHFPESFGDLESLDSLWARWNEIEYLPELFGNLDDLNYVRMESNNLTELPASISNLATIEELFFSYNSITFLPEDIGNLTTLQFLSLGYNSIDYLPESMSELSSLVGLFVNANGVTNVPENIGDLSNLQYLGLDANDITTIPESIGNLSMLGYIGLTDNLITSLPESFGNLEADTVLLTSNYIPELPATMFDNTYQYLWVDYNNLQFGSLEPIIGQVTGEFLYDPQTKFGTDTIVEMVKLQPFSYTLECSGENNIYQWYKDGDLLPGETSNTLYFESAQIEHQGTYKLKVTNTTVTGLELTSYDVELSLVTGIDEVETADFSIYPNPAIGNTLNITVDNSDHVESFQILNTTGQLMITEQIINNNSTVDISDLSNGIYIVKIAYKIGLSQIEKLIVK